MDLAFGTVSPPPVEADIEPGLSEVLDRIRQATGHQRLSRILGEIRMEGFVRNQSIDRPFSLTFAADGKFLEKIEGACVPVFGFDGLTAWELDRSGLPYVYESRLRERPLRVLIGWIRTGYWLDERSRLDVSLLSNESNEKQIALRLRDSNGETECTLMVDRSTWLPSEVFKAPYRCMPVWRFEDYRRVLGVLMPHRLWNNEPWGRGNGVYTIQSIKNVPPRSPDSYEPITRAPSDTVFATDASPRIDLRVCESGHLLVRPLLNGTETGWFLLDTGASHSSIDLRSSERHGMENLGLYDWGLAGTLTRTDMFRARSIGFASVAVANPLFLGIDMTPISCVTGETVEGVLGYDFFRRVVIELDVSGGTFRLLDPAKCDRPSLKWGDLMFLDRLPYIQCHFEGDRNGLFLIDTGSNATVRFNGSATTALDLLGGRVSDESFARDVVGNLLHQRKGALEWFEMGGHRIQGPVTAWFRDPHSGDEPYERRRRAGVVGTALLRRFRMTIDYSRKRVAFMPRYGRGGADEKPSSTRPDS